MSYCSKCGSYIPDSALKCPACGKLKIGAAETAQQAERQTKPQSGFDSSSAQRSQSYHYGYTQSEQHTSGESRPKQDPYARYETGVSAEDQDAEENKVLAALGYLGPMVVLPLILKPNSPFVRFHANQSIALLIFSVLCSICRWIPFFGWMISAFGAVFTLVNVFRGFFGALGGKKIKLPMIGDINILGRGGTK